VALVLTLVTDRRRLPRGEDLPALAAEAARAGIDRVQVREKGLSDRALLALLRGVARALAGGRAELVVNGRPDLAELAGAAGVQLPAAGLEVADVRRRFPALAVGASCHSADDVARAEDAGAHWAVLGPIFSTPGKESRALGLRALAQAAAAARIPVHAVGGIGPAQARAVAEAGARGILAIRAFVDEPVALAVGAFRRALA
jgi:thiamine-phosphate diphosphorylase